MRGMTLSISLLQLDLSLLWYKGWLEEVPHVQNPTVPRMEYSSRARLIALSQGARLGSPRTACLFGP